MNKNQVEYRGRFAPTPSGDLHFGSLVCAVGSYLQARKQKGEWLLRIDDLDLPRAVPGATERILKTLETFHLFWDGEVEYQHYKHDQYLEILEKLKTEALAYPCYCSRKEITATAKRGKEGYIYSGTCRSVADSLKESRAFRVLTTNEKLGWNDFLFGKQESDLKEEVGDFIIWRGDNLCSYHLATVIDDFEIGVTEIVRGSDLLLSTMRQIHLLNLLDYPTPSYFHLPVVTNEKGEKLSKQTLAKPLSPKNANKDLFLALLFLEQTPPPELAEETVPTILEWGIENWDPNKIRKTLGRVMPSVEYAEN